ncbi:MAG: hypothetical protein JNM55_02195 [Anaerolineales bacterium]|nr:hypothetical protein [Anaerolineales bacterium]
MSNELSSESHPDQPMVYQIRIKGHLSRQWADWFERLTITLEDDGNTLLTGLVIDQAALHGLLKKVRDLGMPLLSVNRVNLNQADSPIVKPVLDANNQEKSDS